MAGKMLPPNLQEIVSGVARRRSRGHQRAGSAEYGGTVRKCGLHHDSRPSRFRAQQPVPGHGVRAAAADLGRHLVPQSAGGSLSGRGQQLRPVITQWPGRAAEEVEQQVTIPIEIVDERNSAPRASALVFRLRPFQRDADLRRRIGQRLESPESAGAALAGHAAGQSAAADRLRLQPGRPDLLVHAEEHESQLSI